MHCYKCPKGGKGSNTYSMNDETLSADFSASPYQWDKMLPIYERGKYIDEEAKAISELMRQVDISVNMDYKSNFSPSYTRSAQNAPIKYFGYSPNVNRYTRNYYSEQEWMDMVFNELSQHRPIYYSDNDRNWGNGHAFVIDGYNTEGRVYVNWGWGGYRNGCFDIGILTPKNSGDYSYYQDMIVGIHPKKQGTWKSHLTLYYGSQLTIEELSRRAISKGGAKVWNVDSTPVNDTLALVIEGSGLQRDPKTTNYRAKDGCWNSILRERILIPADLPDNDHRVYLRLKDNRDANQQVIRSGYGRLSSVVINVANDTFSVKGDRTNYDWVTAIGASTISNAETPTGVYDLQGHKLL